MRYAGIAILLAAGSLLAAEAGPEARRPTSLLERMTPAVMPTDDVGARAKAAAAVAAAAAKAASEIRVDEKTQAVRLPVRATRARGVVEWLLQAGRKQAQAAVFITERPAGDLAAAFQKAGWAAGRHPELVSDDKARPPAGLTLRIDVIVRTRDGKETRTPAATYLSAQSDGRPLGEGTWVYAGTQVIRADGTDILLSNLAGSVVTTNLRDSSAMIYWVPKDAPAEGAYVSGYYASAAPLPEEGATVELELAPAKKVQSEK